MQKIRALAIAPYEGMRLMIENTAKTKPDIEITTYLGNLELGVDLIRSLDLSKYDVIISRGGTAKMIRAVTNLPVIEIMLSHYDVLNCMKLAENYPGKYAIIGFPSITGFASVLCDILQLKIKIVKLESTAETREKLIEIKEQGYSMVLSDTTAIETAKEMGMNAMLITSSAASIEAAIDQAANLCRYHINTINQNLFYSAMMEHERKIIIVYKDDSLFFSNFGDSQAGLLNFTRKMIPEVKKLGVREADQKIGKDYYHIKGFQAEIKKTPVIMFIAYKADSYNQPVVGGVTAALAADVETNYFNLLYNSQNHSELKSEIEQYSKSSKPVLITGEVGTGKDEAAQIIFRNSNFSRQTLYIVDFMLVGEKDWQYLMDNPFSCFMDNGNTFYLKNMLRLPPEKLNQLFTFIEHSKLAQRNRLIFSIQHNNEEIRELPLYQIIKHKMECHTVHLTPLREQGDDIPTMVSIFLNEYNMLNAKQISGCEPEGMRYLQEFRWEYNLNQLRRVLNNLATAATGTFISAESIQKILAEESSSIAVNNSNLPGISFDKTMDEIMYDVATEVLQREKMNQTKTAQKLGISRTTLWRILNRK